MNAPVRSDMHHRAVPVAAPVVMAALGNPFHRPAPLSYFTAGTEVYAQDGKVDSFFDIAFGAVRVFRLLPDGRRQITAFYLAGETFGFEPDLTHHFFAEAIVATALRTHRPSAGQDMATVLLPLALRCMVQAQEHLLVVGRKNSVERIAAFLIDMADRQDGIVQLELPMSRQDIGDYLGLSIETVSRTLSRLRDNGVLKFHGLRLVEIRKPDDLRAMSE